MDPLSITASIIALLQLTGSVLGYINSITEAPRGRANLAIELSNLNTLLTQLRYRVDGVCTGDAWFVAISTLALPKGPLDQLRGILDLLKPEADPGHGAKELAKKLTWKFDSAKIEGLLLSIERLKSLVGLALNNDLFALCQNLQSDLAYAKLDLSEIKKVVQESLEVQQGLTRRALDVEHADIAEWLSPLEFWSPQQANLAARHEGTGQWLLDSQEFQDWLEGKEKWVLLSGNAGTGKTILSSIVIDHLQARCVTADSTVAWIYCNYKERTEQTPYNLLASLLKQIFPLRPELFEVLKKTRSSHKTKGSRPTLQEITKLLCTATKAFQKVFIVIDALDEITAEQVKDEVLASELHNLPENTFIMITTRAIPTIEAQFATAKRLEVLARDEDVESYVFARIFQEHRLAKHAMADPTLITEIVTKIVSNAKGMFLLAKMHMDSIASKPTRKGVRKALEDLPSGLVETYDEAMQRIKSQNPENVEFALKVLCWAAFSLRPLSVLELQHALIAEPGMKELDDDDLPDDEMIVSVCAGLVTIDRESLAVRLVHHTAQVYFERQREAHFPNAHRDITLACLAYLSLDTFADDDEDFATFMKKHRRFVLGTYAARYWHHHALEVQDDELASTTVLNYLQAPSRVLTGFYFHRFPELKRHFEPRVRLHRKLYNGMHGLHLAALLGLEKTVERLVQLGNDINTPDFQGQTPLFYVVGENNESALKFLVKRGDVNVNSKNYNGETALSIAVKLRTSREGIVRLLLADPKIVVDSKDKQGRTALMLAIIEYGHEKVVALLLAHPGVDINAMDEEGRTPISHAVYQGREKMVELLLRQPNIDLKRLYSLKGIDERYETNTSDELGMTTMTLLHLALGRPARWKIREGHIKALRMLLATKAFDINARDGWGATVLHRSTNRWLHGALNALLEQEEIDVNARDNDGETPLHWAARHDHRYFAILLKHSLIDVNAQGKDGCTVLHSLAVAFDGEDEEQLESIRLLLERKDVQINLRDCQGQTPLTVFEKRHSAEGDAKEVIDLVRARGGVI